MSVHNSKHVIQDNPYRHEIPERPWSRVAADLFILHGESYIALMDYFSDFIEVAELPDTTSSSVIQFLKEQYSRHCIPDCLVTDNGSQIVSQEFMQFATDWEFKHVTSSHQDTRDLMAKQNLLLKFSRVCSKKLLKIIETLGLLFSIIATLLLRGTDWGERH